MKIAFVCYTVQEKYRLQGTDDEDSLLLNFLKSKNLDIHLEIWNNETVNWGYYDLVLLKAPWDYHDNITLFYNWMDKLHNLSIPMLNPH